MWKVEKKDFQKSEKIVKMKKRRTILIGPV